MKLKKYISDFSCKQTELFAYTQLMYFLVHKETKQKVIFPVPALSLLTPCGSSGGKALDSRPRGRGFELRLTQCPSSKKAQDRFKLSIHCPFYMVHGPMPIF